MSISCHHVMSLSHFLLHLLKLLVFYIFILLVFMLSVFYLIDRFIDI